MAIQNLHSFLEQTVDKLFEPEERRLNDLVIELDQANREIKKYTVPGFMHAGEVYVPKGKQRPKSVPSLAFTLSRQAAQFVTEHKIVEDDKQLIMQVLWLATKDCETVLDVRNALPETIVNLTSLKEHPRLNEDGYTLKGNERLYNQYLAMRDKIDVYWACSMIY